MATYQWFAAILLNAAVIVAGQLDSCTPIDGVYTVEGFRACLVATKPTLNKPRGLWSSPETNGWLLVLDKRIEANSAAIVAIPTRSDVGDDAVELWTGSVGLNHGITVCSGFLFASSRDKIYRWPYTGEAKPFAGGSMRTIYQGLDFGETTGKFTRSLSCAIDEAGERRLVVSIGASATSEQSDRSTLSLERGVILAFGQSQFSQAQETLATDFEGFSAHAVGELLAIGLRNAVALGMSTSLPGRPEIVAIDCGVDSLPRKDLDTNIIQKNPAEEVLRIPVPKVEELTPRQVPSFGFPRCWTEWRADKGRGVGYQWGHTATLDAFCVSPENNAPPSLVLPAHTAPLGLRIFGTDFPARENTTSGGMPRSLAGALFVATHTPSQLEPPTGASIEAFRDPLKATLSTLSSTIVWTTDMNGLRVRPVDVAFDREGRLYFSSDSTGQVIRVECVNDDNCYAAFVPPPPSEVAASFGASPFTLTLVILFISVLSTFV